MTYRQPNLDNSPLSPFDLELTEFWEEIEKEGEVDSSEADFMKWLGETATSDTVTAVALSPWDLPTEIIQEDINELSRQLFTEGEPAAPQNDKFWADLWEVPEPPSRGNPPVVAQIGRAHV